MATALIDAISTTIDRLAMRTHSTSPPSALESFQALCPLVVGMGDESKAKKVTGSREEMIIGRSPKMMPTERAIQQLFLDAIQYQGRDPNRRVFGESKKARALEWETWSDIWIDSTTSAWA